MGRYPIIKDIKLVFEISFSSVNGKYPNINPIVIDLNQFEGTWISLEEKNKKSNLECTSENITEIKQMLDRVTSKYGIFGINVSLMNKKDQKDKSAEDNNNL